jgi:NodT family efflux transporter outer membrane factor (OMF) lipoprotein
MLRFRVPTALLLLAGVSACATVPRLGPPPAPRAADSLASGRSLAGPAGAWPAADWWTGYHDPALDRLMAEALSGSPDVAAAAARVRAADAIAAQAGAALRPTLTGEGTAGGNKQSQNQGVPPEFVPDGIQDTARLAAVLSFDLDLWGRNRAALAAARGEAAAARIDAAQSRLMLTTGIASAYADLARAHDLRDVARDMLKARETTVALTAERVRVGVDTRGSLRQAQVRVPQARAEIAALDEQIALTQHRIAALLGAGPDRGLTIARPVLTAPPSGVPPQAGIDLIGRRPELAAARLRAEAAADRIKVARADFYPNISLSVVAGFQALGFGRLFQGTSSAGSGGAAFTLPIFDSGRIAGRYAGARAAYDGAVAQYDSALITALRDVADTLSSQGATDRQLGEQTRALTAAEEGSAIIVARYRGGLANQLQVLVTADTLLATRRTVAELKARRLALDIALIRALGGGYRASPANAGSQ